MKEIKGIYYNKISGNVFFVNSVEHSIVRVSTVLTVGKGDTMVMTKVLNDEKVIALDVFKTFTFSGNYTRDIINK